MACASAFMSATHWSFWSVVASLNLLHKNCTSLSSLLWRRRWQPTPAFLPGESQGRRSLVGCRPFGVAQSWTRLKRLSSSSSSCLLTSLLKHHVREGFGKLNLYCLLCSIINALTIKNSVTVAHEGVLLTDTCADGMLCGSRGNTLFTPSWFHRCRLAGAHIDESLFPAASTSQHLSGLLRKKVSPDFSVGHASYRFIPRK